MLFELLLVLGKEIPHLGDLGHLSALSSIQTPVHRLTSFNTEPQWASLMYHDLLLSIFITPNDLVTCSVSLSSGPASSSSISTSLESPVDPTLAPPDMAANAAAGPPGWLPLVINDRTNPSRRSIRFCISSGVVGAVCWVEFFLREVAWAYEQEAASPRLTQFSHGWVRLHFSLRQSLDPRPGQRRAATYFLLRQGAHERGTRFRLRMILKSGEWPPTLEDVDGGVGVIMQGLVLSRGIFRSAGHGAAALPGVIVALDVATYSIFCVGVHHWESQGRAWGAWPRSSRKSQVGSRKRSLLSPIVADLQPPMRKIAPLRWLGCL